ncbi:dTDP-4-dehydrorhamnose 3,5-epimerase family protein [Actinomadura rubteroloni]|nr:dTDP-4-dehydrorhamnose 3,5-epimerase [Actinomadura rubteroloni]
MEPLSLDGAHLISPVPHPDERGELYQIFDSGELRAAVGHAMRVSQANCLVSRRGAIRGIHFAEVPPGQAKYVMCPSGSVLDVIVDLRVGSPTFGHWESVVLDDARPRCVYVAEGLGHALMALSERAAVVYLCSRPYTPEREHAVNPMDDSIGIDWPADIQPILSERDRGAPTLAEAERAGVLPTYAACQAFASALRAT